MPNLYNSFYTKEGHYYWLDPNDLQVRVSFHLRDGNPFDSNLVSFVVSDFPDKEDFDTVYDCAVELKSRIDHYLINTDKDKIATLVEYLEGFLYDDKIAALQTEIASLTARISGVSKRLDRAIQEKYDDQLEKANAE